MDLHFLAEAKTRSRWKRETQQQAGQGTWGGGRTTKFGPNVSWRTKVRQIAYDLRLSTAVKKHVLQTFEKLERDNGIGYVDKLDDSQFYYAVKIAANKYSAATKILPRELRKAPVSGIYKQASTLHMRSGFELPPGETEKEKKQRAYAPKSRGGIGAGDQLRANVADVNLGTLTQKELAQHAHPDVKRMYQAITPYSSKIQRDPVVLWNSEGVPFYMFTKLMKVRAEGPVPEKGDTKYYDFMFPRSLSFFNKEVPIEQLGKYKKDKSPDLGGQWNKNTDWRAMFRSEELMKLNIARGTFTVKPVQKNSLADAAGYAQQIAFTRAKPFMTWRKEFLQKQAILEVFEKVEGKHALSKEQEKLRREAFKLYTKAEKALKKLGANYSWYLYLLALEDEHGVLLKSRQSEHPSWPKTRSEVKAKTRHWTIQYTGSEAIPKWESRVLINAGYPTQNLSKFYEDLSKSIYKLGRQSQDAIKHLWIPLGGKLEKFGLHSHKVNIDDYLEKARIKPAENIFGWEGGAIKVLDKKKLSGVHMHQFSGGNPRKSFVLIPAMEYLRWFDSPKHAGARFIHGKKALSSPRRDFDPDDPFKEAARRTPRTKLQKRAADYRASKVLRRPEHPEYYPDIFSKTFKRDLEQQRKDRIKVSADLIQRNIKKQQKKARSQVSFRGRKLARIKQAEQKRTVATLRVTSKRRGTRVTQSPQEVAQLRRALVFRRRASFNFPGLGFAINKDKPWDLPSNIMARERHFTMIPTDRVIGSVKKRSYTSTGPGGVKQTAQTTGPLPVVMQRAKHQMPLPTWKDFLGAANWKAYWAKKPPGQKKLMLQDSTIRKIKAEVRQDYKDKVKSYLRQARSEGFIVIDSSGNEVTLSNLHISNRDLV